MPDTPAEPPPKIEDEESLRAWLKDRPREDAVIIAARVALRILPLIVEAREIDDWPAVIVLPVFSAAASPWLVSHGVAQGEAATRATAHAAATAAYVTSIASSATDVSFAAEAAISAAADAIAADAARAGYAPAAASAAHAAHATDAFWAAVQLDAAALAKGDQISGTALWCGEETPRKIAEASKTLTQSLEGEDDWNVWLTWYQARLEGQDPRPALTFERAVAALTEDDWSQGPAHVNAKLAGSMNGSRGTPTTRERAGPATDERDDAERRLRDAIGEANILLERLDQFGKTTRQVDTLNRTLSDLRRSHEGFLKDFEKAKTEATEGLKSTEENFRASLDRLEQSYLSETTLEAPVSLWQEKQKEHDERRDAAYRLFSRGLIASGLGVVFVVYAIFGQSDVLARFATEGGGVGFRGALAIGAVLTLFTLALWFTRLQMRIFLAERHLALDARERRAFAQAYVAMLRGEVAKLEDDELDPEVKKKISEEARTQKQLVYAALFRPTQDGIIKDDSGMDPSLSAAISKLLTK